MIVSFDKLRPGDIFVFKNSCGDWIKYKYITFKRNKHPYCNILSESKTLAFRYYDNNDNNLVYFPCDDARLKFKILNRKEENDDMGLDFL